MTPVSIGSPADGVYLDTSALYALFDADDAANSVAGDAWRGICDGSSTLHTTNYVLLELSALLQRRLGIGAVDALATHVLPWINVLWIDESLHAQAAAGLLAARRRDLSLVDCASFAAMRRLGLRRVFTLDPHFNEQGFKTVP
jgi:predicted nucleic acid-binding protein